MKYYLRFFIGDSQTCKSYHQFEYTHAARMIIPRIGEHVWLPSEDDDDFGGAKYRVYDIEHDIYDNETTGFVDVYVVRDDVEDYEEEDY